MTWIRGYDIRRVWAGLSALEEWKTLRACSYQKLITAARSLGGKHPGIHESFESASSAGQGLLYIPPNSEGDVVS